MDGKVKVRSLGVSFVLLSVLFLLLTSSFIVIYGCRDVSRGPVWATMYEDSSSRWSVYILKAPFSKFQPLRALHFSSLVSSFSGLPVYMFSPLPGCLLYLSSQHYIFVSII